MSEPILEFSGDYRFLSNFYDYVIDLGGRMFASAEHAYQATKTFDPVWQKDIQLARSPAWAKRLGRACPLREDWDEVRIPMMRLVVAAKFNGDNVVTEKLLATGDRILVEGNNWGDRFWGATWQPLWKPLGGASTWATQPYGDMTSDVLVGQNKLGLLLMERRAELQS